MVCFFVYEELLEDVRGKLILRTPRVNSNVNVQYSTSDAVYETKDIVVNIEVNYGEYQSMDILDELDYTVVKKGNKYSLEKLLYIIVCDDDKRKGELYLNNDIMKEVEKKISSLTEDFDKELYYDREQLLKNCLYEQGANEKAIEIAKKLLLKKMSMSDIIDITGLSEEEVSNIIID